jgi:hypothetical protein
MSKIAPLAISEPKFGFWMAPNLPLDARQAIVSAIIKFAIDPPATPSARRTIAVRQAAAVYDGSPTGRAKKLEQKYRAYLTNGWLRERDLELLSHPRSVERAALHRLAKYNHGRSLCWRHILRIIEGGV